MIFMKVTQGTITGTIPEQHEHSFEHNKIEIKMKLKNGKLRKFVTSITFML